MKCKICWTRENLKTQQICYECDKKQKILKAKNKSDWNKKSNKENKTKKRIYAPTGEKELFEKIWNTRRRECKLCWIKIREPKSQNFAHILNKGMYPDMRLVEDNIVILCLHCHTKMDKIVSDKWKAYIYRNWNELTLDYILFW